MKADALEESFEQFELEVDRACHVRLEAVSHQSRTVVAQGSRLRGRFRFDCWKPASKKSVARHRGASGHGTDYIQS